MIRQAQRRLLRLFARFDRPAAWVLMVAGLVTFVTVVADLIALGNARLGTALIAADLFVSGFSATQEAENDEEPGDDVQRMIAQQDGAAREIAELRELAASLAAAVTPLTTDPPRLSRQAQRTARDALVMYQSRARGRPARAG